MFSLLRRIWDGGDGAPQNPDVILPLSYGVVSSTRLADATEAGLAEAVWYGRKFPRAKIAYGNCAHFFKGSEDVERRLKELFLSSCEFPLTRLIVPMNGIDNSVTEQRAIKSALDAKGLQPKEILILGEWVHAWSAIYIARRVFPGVRLAVVCTETTACQDDHLFAFQRNRLMYVALSIIRYAALILMGLDWVSKIRHKS